MRGKVVLVLAWAALMVGAAQAQAPMPANAIETATGMHYVVLSPAKSGPATVSPTFIQYRALIKNAAGETVLDSKKSGVQSAAFVRLAKENPALARALLSTPIGETRRWWLQATGQVIDLTVLGNYDPLKAPDDVAAPPKDAQTTFSGLAYRVLSRGPGGPKPSLSSTIEIHYSGWTTDGKLFDSSVQRDEHAIFPLNGLIAGWQEGLQLMSPGDSFRFWIPGDLAYDKMPPREGTPRGMLVFDVTLYGVQ